MTLPAELVWQVTLMLPQKEDGKKKLPFAVSKDWLAGCLLWWRLETRGHIQGRRILAERWHLPPTRGDVFSLKASILMHPLPHISDYHVRLCVACLL